MADRSILDLETNDSATNDDTLVSIVSGKASRVSLGYVQSIISAFILNSIQSNLHTHENKIVLDKLSVDDSGNLLYDGNAIKADGIDFSTLSNMFVEGDNISIVVDNESQKITFSSTGGIDFPSLAVALTTGIQNGITVTADESNGRFNFEVTSIPTIAIDSEGYWTINGELGENPTKAQGEKGADGISPTAIVSDTGNGASIAITDKNGTTTVEVFDGADGISPIVSVAQTESGCTITIEDSSGITTADLTNGTDGITPHIDETTKHWMIGDTDTNIIAEGVTTISTTSMTYTGTLSVDGWVGDSAPYTQDVEIIGITPDLSPFIDLIISDDITTSDEEITQWSCVTKATTGDNIITFKCYKTKPTIELNFKVKVV